MTAAIQDPDSSLPDNGQGRGRPPANDSGDGDGWSQANQRYLVAKLAVIQTLLGPASHDGSSSASHALEQARAAMLAPPAIDVVATLFDLSPFECDLLLMCAGVELDATFASRCAAAQGDPRRIQPTFSLALAALPGAHWSALSPAAPLRRFHLVSMSPGESLTRAPLYIDERVLHYLTGIDHPDERLHGVIEPAIPPTDLVPSHRTLVTQIIDVWTRSAPGANLPGVRLLGGDPTTRHRLAAAACAVLNLRLDVVSAAAFVARSDVDLLGRLLVREMILGPKALLVELDDLDTTDPTKMLLIGRLVDRLPGLVFLSGHQRIQVGQRVSVTVHVQRPSADEQLSLWKSALSPVLEANGHGRQGEGQGGDIFSQLVAQFDLDERAISMVSATVALGTSPLRLQEEGGLRGMRSLGTALWDACRVETRRDLDGLIRRIEPDANWDDLVLPEATKKTLREMVSSVRQRWKVHGTWGFADKVARGLGVGALLTGPSGTGKTLAAEVLASDLRLDLYCIDLSQLVSKYIGETEKNLRRVFDAAERGAAILLFDEADALFGRRGEVRDGHDRYANLEIAYLLQRMESYRGLAILTTNLERSMDPAFLRRIRFVVRFPLPGAVERAAIWRRAFPRQTPTEGLDIDRLSQMSLTGGSIRNVAIRAAFLAAEANTPVRMGHILEAAQAEYDKLGRGVEL